MNRTEILLNSRKNKNNTNEDSFISVDLNSYEKNIAPMEDSFNVDAYQQYFKEKDASEKYRLAFTITPFCTNVLFNVITEPVYREGASDCVTVLTNGTGGGAVSRNYKPLQWLTRKDLIRDTGFSHPKACADGGFVYHCGYDIFNNHYLRKKEYAVVASGKTDANFNTIQDTVRDSSHNVVENFSLFESSGGTRTLNSASGRTHLYCQDTVYSYTEAVFENLIENNGWFGFLNAATLPIDNVTLDGENYSINKCMNNNKAWEQIDMYPDRSLYSFVPKINKYRNNRIEKNWDYCITYPKEIDSGHTLVTDEENGVNGIFCKIDTEIPSNGYDESGVITFKSSINHNLNRGDYVSISFVSTDGTEMKTPSPVRVVGIGQNGGDQQHYFSVRTVAIPEVFFAKTDRGVRIRKCDGRNEAQYYLRKFYKLEKLPSNSLNKLAFSQNAYSDQVVQVVFTDDVDTTGMVDYFGRPVSELFLTIVKRNKGWDKWYSTRQAYFTSEDIEFSHCFGEVTSGFDMPADKEFFKDYNVRRIHSVAQKNINGITNSPEKLESGITIDKKWFYGDVVEFFPNKVQETIINDVYHRFNTAQRETLNNEYSGFTYDEITSDDFFFGAEFEIEEKPLIKGNNTHINLLPEGYYYKPHYRVVVKEFSPEVQMGQHTKLAIRTAQQDGSRYEWTLTLVNNYYFQEGDRVLYCKSNGEVINGECTDILTSDRKMISVKFDSAVNIDSNSVLYRQNPIMPDGAYELKDGSGRYVWRDVMKYSDMLPENELYDDLFTNGAHYHHKNISFYLKRQDPDGIYGIGLEPKSTVSFFSVEGRENKEVSYAEYQKEEEGDIC